MKLYNGFYFWITSILCLFLGINFLFSPTIAQASVGVSITPLKFDLQANPGDVIQKTVTAINPNDVAISVIPEFQDFKMEEMGITFIPPDADNPWKMSDWIEIQTAPILLAPKEYREVPFTIRVPKNAGAGGKYAAVFFKLVNQGGGAGFGATARVGALILLDIQGEIHKTGEFTGFETSFFHNKGPVIFQATFKNTGTAHYDIQAGVAIYNFLGFKKYDIISETRFITPEQIRHLKATWDKTWPIGIFKATAAIADGEGTIYKETVWFIGFPWVWFLVGLAILAALYMAFKFLKKKFKIVKV